MSQEELADMPPFPFPKELFPPGTFPEGLRFSSEGLGDLPPAIEAFMAGDNNEIDVAALFEAAADDTGEHLHAGPAHSSASVLMHPQMQPQDIILLLCNDALLA